KGKTTTTTAPITSTVQGTTTTTTAPITSTVQGTTTTTTAPITSTTTGCPGCCGVTVGTGLSQPLYITIDVSGNFFVSDSGSSEIIYFTPGSTTGTTVYSGGDYYEGIHIISNETVYFADHASYCVRKSTNATGNATCVAGVDGVSGLAPNHFNFPKGVYAENTGTFYVADSMNKVVLKFFSNSTSGTNGTIVAGNQTAPTLSSPSDVYLVSGSGNLYVADSGNKHVVRWSSGADPTTGGVVVASNTLNSIFGIVVTADEQTLFVSDQGANCVKKFTIGTDSATIFAGNGTAGSGPHQLSGPVGLALDSTEQYLYVVDTGNTRIQRFYIPS
ncbi:unnamed protein product, partial [Didymodactylos carnosus]